MLYIFICLPFLESQLHEAFAFFQGDGVQPRGAVQRLGGSSHHDDHGVPRPVTGEEVVDGVTVHWTDP